MRFFWPIYLSVAVVGTLGVYVVAPLARPALQRAQPSLPSEPAMHMQGQSRAPAPASSASVSVAPVAAVPRVTTVAPASVRATDTDEELMPSLLGIFLAQSGERPGWGVTKQQTALFSTEGTRLSQTPGGTLFTYAGAHTSSKGRLIAAFLQGQNKALLISQNDVLLFTGSFTNLSVRQRSDLQTYYQLNDKIIKRKQSLLQIAAEKNPLFPAYQAAHKRLMENIDAAKKLAAQRDGMSDWVKTQTENKLRELKIENVRLRAEYDEIHTRFRAWKTTHAKELPMLDQDTEVRQWRQQMTTCCASIAGLTYSDEK